MIKKNSCCLDYDWCSWDLCFLCWLVCTFFLAQSKAQLKDLSLHSGQRWEISLRQTGRATGTSSAGDLWIQRGKWLLGPGSTAFYICYYSWLIFFHSLLCGSVCLISILKICCSRSLCVCYRYLSYRIKLNCSHMGTALHPPKFSSHKMDVICDFGVLLFQVPDLVPLPVTRSWLRISEDGKYSIMSTFWTDSSDN